MRGPISCCRDAQGQIVFDAPTLSVDVWIIGNGDISRTTEDWPCHCKPLLKAK
jgi:hypothetical protein